MKKATGGIIVFINNDHEPHAQSYSNEQEKRAIFIKLIDNIKECYNLEEFGVPVRNYKSMKIGKLEEYLEDITEALDIIGVFDLADDISRAMP